MKNINFKILFFVLLLLFSFSFLRDKPLLTAGDYELDEQSASIAAIKKVKPAVVSIIVYDYSEKAVLSVADGKESTAKIRIEAGRGTGFLISPDGYIITNKHVFGAVNEKTGEYRVILNSGKEYYAQLIAKDPADDLAFLKIFDKELPFVELGDSDTLEIGMSAIAIGNALGMYENTVTKGIISGLGRSVVAGDGRGNLVRLDSVIQTDADINRGNSGGPLIDLAGRVIGINTAIEEEGRSIGFAIPVNDARPAIKSVVQEGLIIRPFLGVRYLMLNGEIARDNEIDVLEGAWITEGNDGAGPAIAPNSPAEKAGLRENDIVLEVNAIKINKQNTLAGIIRRYRPGDKIGLRILRDDKIIIKIIELVKM